MGQAEPVKKLSFEEYLAIEAETQTRHEYYHGEVFAMAGGTRRHNRLIGNSYRFFFNSVREKDCSTYFNDVKLELDQGAYYVYPDLMLVCEETDLDPLMVKAPSLILEVLSPSTQDYDKSTKLEAYLRLPSLQYYLLVSQTGVRIEVFAKLEQGWLFNYYESREEVISLDLLGGSLEVGKVYENILF